MGLYYELRGTKVRILKTNETVTEILKYIGEDVVLSQYEFSSKK